MNVLEEFVCPICNLKYKADYTKFEPCPKCCWVVVGVEDQLTEDEKDACNAMSIKEAKENVAKGLTIWGDPLPPKPKEKEVK
jgi:hypothetical protein